MTVEHANKNYALVGLSSCMSQLVVFLRWQWTTNGDPQFDYVLVRIPVWILAKVVMQLEDAYLNFESNAMSTYQTGSGEGYGLVCCWAYKLEQFSTWKVSYLQGNDGFIPGYKVSLKQPYFSFAKKVQEMVMSGSQVVTEIKSLLIYACVISYEEEDKEQDLTMIYKYGDTPLMLCHPARTPDSQGWEVRSGDNGPVYPLDINKSESGSWVVAGFHYKEDEKITTSVLTEASIVKQRVVTKHDKLSFTEEWLTSALDRDIGKALHLNSPFLRTRMSWRGRYCHITSRGRIVPLINLVLVVRR